MLAINESQGMTLKSHNKKILRKVINTFNKCTDQIENSFFFFFKKKIAREIVVVFNPL